MAIITIETVIHAPVELCFDMTLDVRVHERSAAFSGERLVAPGRTAGILELGDLVTFEGRHFGLRQRFTTRIVELDRPGRFVDEMVQGTFKSLRHIHEFRRREDVTVMIDVLDWTPPLGIIGKAADMLFLKRHMEWFVRTKQSALKQLVEDAAARAAVPE